MGRTEAATLDQKHQRHIIMGLLTRMVDYDALTSHGFKLKLQRQVWDIYVLFFRYSTGYGSLEEQNQALRPPQML